MESIKKRNISLLLTVFGSLFYSVLRVPDYFDYVNNSKFVYDEMRYYLLSISLLFYLTGIITITFREKNKFLSVIWVESYAVGGMILWERGGFPYLYFVPFVLFELLLITVILEFVGIKSKPVKVASRVIWFSVFVLEIVITIISFCTESPREPFAPYAYNLAWVFMALFTMAETMSILKHISKYAIFIGLAATVLLAIYSFWPNNSEIADPITKIMKLVPAVIMILTYLFYTLWLHKSESENVNPGFIKCVLIGVIGALCGALFYGCYEKVYAKDSGVIRYNIEQAFYELLREDQYNWYEITGDKSMVSTLGLEYSIVDLGGSYLPVMFLRGGMISEASGNTRIVFYDEATNRPHQVWGNVNCVEVKGYVPCDETQEYPLIVCEGGRQDVYHEYIFEVKNGELCLVAEKDDAWPFDTDETDPEGSSVNDTYQWNGNEVSMDQYLTNREAALSGYQDINWKIW